MRLRLVAIPGVVFVAVAAAMWGTDPIIRKTMSVDPETLLPVTSSTTIVFGEHVILVLCTLPFLFPALRAVFRAGPRFVAAAVFIGAGASAVATILFTDALIGHNDLITPVVIQKIQPLIAILAAAVILGERPRPRFLWFLFPALVGFWLLSFPDPFDVSANGVVVIAEASGAAILWALGTVLGRYLSRKIEFQHVLSLRFFFGFLASAIALLVMNQPAYSNRHDTVLILYLALVTGLLALGLYYFGLQHTPAMMASVAELTFPVVAIVAGIYAYSTPEYQVRLSWSQWLGVAIVLVTVTLLPMQRRRDIVKETVPDFVPEPVPA